MTTDFLLTVVNAFIPILGAVSSILTIGTFVESHRKKRNTNDSKHKAVSQVNNDGTSKHDIQVRYANRIKNIRDYSVYLITIIAVWEIFLLFPVLIESPAWVIAMLYPMVGWWPVYSIFFRKERDYEWFFMAALSTGVLVWPWVFFVFVRGAHATGNMLVERIFAMSPVVGIFVCAVFLIYYVGAWKGASSPGCHGDV